ncbi:hypothetical protein [Paracoccus salsus]|uniref:hypothetical protein n=1 Tax=Paracoccus salsus TaxID=2911061 RepID=UPI001F18945D|nr:hypothetical protein [Paracoccus salsus]MCF3972540.1 hypothetical protein [Paracoccus salsus]
MTWTLTSGDVVISVSARLDGNGNVTFEYNLVSGVADLNGFYLDIANDGGDISRLDGGNNMKGSDSDGDKLDGFDYATELGSVGGNDADHTSGSITVSLADLGISSLAELAESEVGFRATSVGEDREDSLKLAATGELCEDDEDDDSGCGTLPGGEINLHYPTTEGGAATLTVVFAAYFDQDEGWLPPHGDANDDWLYAIELNAGCELPTDLDTYIDKLLSELSEINPNITPESILKGVFIETADGVTDFYASHYNANGELPDDFPGDFTLDPETGKLSPPELIEISYDLGIAADSFEFTELTSDLIV